MTVEILFPKLCNPLFTEYLMGLAGVENPCCAFRTQAMAAFERRLSEFRNKRIPF